MSGAESTLLAGTLFGTLLLWPARRHRHAAAAALVATLCVLALALGRAWDGAAAAWPVAAAVAASAALRALLLPLLLRRRDPLPAVAAPPGRELPPAWGALPSLAAGAALLGLLALLLLPLADGAAAPARPALLAALGAALLGLGLLARRDGALLGLLSLDHAAALLLLLWPGAALLPGAWLLPPATLALLGAMLLGEALLRPGRGGASPASVRDEARHAAGRDVAPGGAA